MIRNLNLALIARVTNGVNNVNNPNQFNTASSYFTNEAILAGLGYPTVCNDPDRTRYDDGDAPEEIDDETSD